MRNWLFATLVLLGAVTALAIRLPQLNLRPMHCDEAVHAVKSDTLWTTGKYTYDRSDYHGPTLYYFTMPSLWLSGASDFGATTEATFRIVPVLFGVALVLLLLLVGDGLGRPAAVCAGLLLALSPAMVYYSRYYIQETLLVVFTFAAVAAGWRYVQSRRTGWALLAGACLGLMHATKETCVIAYGAMTVAVLGTIVWNRWTGIATNDSRAGDTEPCEIRRSVPASERSRWNKWILGGAAAIGIGTSVLLYSAFFTNASGPVDSVRALAAYVNRAAGNTAHNHPWYYYLRMLLLTHYPPGPVWSEAFILVLAAVGAATAVGPWAGSGAHATMVRFLVLYTVFMTAVYSAIQHKTPWCMVQFLHPMILLAGVGAAALVRRVWRTRAWAAVCVLLLAGAADLGRQAHAASFKFYASNRNPYAYAHPVDDVKRLAAWVEQMAVFHPDRHRMLVKVIAPDPWPLPWYLRRFERVGYWEELPENPDAPVVIVASELQPALNERLQNTYQSSHYGLRPGVVLIVHVDRKLWQALADRLNAPRRLKANGATQ